VACSRSCSATWPALRRRRRAARWRGPAAVRPRTRSPRPGGLRPPRRAGREGAAIDSRQSRRGPRGVSRRLSLRGRLERVHRALRSSARAPAPPRAARGSSTRVWPGELPGSVFEQMGQRSNEAVVAGRRSASHRLPGRRCPGPTCWGGPSGPRRRRRDRECRRRTDRGAAATSTPLRRPGPGSGRPLRAHGGLVMAPARSETARAGRLRRILPPPSSCRADSLDVATGMRSTRADRAAPARGRESPLPAAPAARAAALGARHGPKGRLGISLRDVQRGDRAGPVVRQARGGHRIVLLAHVRSLASSMA